MIVEWWFMDEEKLCTDHDGLSYESAKRRAENLVDQRPQFLVHKDTGKCEMKAPGMSEWKTYPDLDTAAVAARLRG